MKSKNSTMRHIIKMSTVTDKNRIGKQQEKMNLSHTREFL